ncbi:MAG: type II toxin-antitoxin system RelE/ParE family toxin [Nitrospirota bacterium]
MTYKVVIERKAQKEAQKIPPKFRSLIDETIISLSSNPRPTGSKKLTEKEGYRVRIGNYRILYTVDDKAKVIVIYRIKIKGKSTYK